MKKLLFSVMVLVGWFLLSPSVQAGDFPQALVSAEWLQKNLNDPAVFVLDIRKVEDYREGHVPGAVSLTYAAWRTMKENLDCQLPLKEDLRDSVCSSGINADTYVVIVGNTDTEQQRMNSTRVAWTLKYAGVKRPVILDGGYKQWSSRNYAVSTDWVKRPKSNYQCKWNEGVLAAKGYVKSHLKGAAIVDTRPSPVYKGEVPDPKLKKKGHIPGAVNLPYELVYTKDGAFENRGTLQSLAYKVVGDSKEREIIVLCCNGQFASAWWFALSEMLGYKDVKIYDGSMEDWCGDEGAPLEK